MLPGKIEQAVQHTAMISPHQRIGRLTCSNMISLLWVEFDSLNLVQKIPIKTNFFTVVEITNGTITAVKSTAFNGIQSKKIAASGFLRSYRTFPEAQIRAVDINDFLYSSLRTLTCKSFICFCLTFEVLPFGPDCIPGIFAGLKIPFKPLGDGCSSQAMKSRAISTSIFISW